MLSVAGALILSAGPALAQTTDNLLMNTYANTTFSGAPLTSGAISTIDQTNLNPAGRGNFFSVRITGYIYAATTGTYSFETYSDDGVRLFVNSTTVIDNYGLHAPTFNFGTVDLVAGNWYPIQIDHYEWGGGQRLRLRWRTPGAGSYAFPPSTSLTQVLPVLAPPLTTEAVVSEVIAEEATRSLRADIENNQKANQDARARHAAALRCQALRDEADVSATESECRDDLVSRSSTPLSFSGNLAANATGTRMFGKFFHQNYGQNGQSRRLFFGDFNVSRYEGGDVSAVFTARFARERMVDDVLVGYFVGVSATHSDLSANVNGNRAGYGLSAGTYFVDQLGEKLIWDGFLAVGTGRNNLDINDGGGDITSDYNTSSILFGLALSGSKEYESFEVRPELSLSFGYTDIGNVALEGASSAVVDAGGVTLGRASFAPDFIIPLDASGTQFDESALWITPSIACEYQETTTSDQDCGGGLALEWTASSDDGRHDLSVRVSREVLGGQTRDSIGLQLESVF